MEKQRDRRRESRKTVNSKRLLALVYGKPISPYHVVDIGPGGLSFRYFDLEPWPERKCRIDLLYRGELILEKVDVDTVSDIIITQGGVTVRRRGVKFASLPDSARRKLHDFMTGA